MTRMVGYLRVSTREQAEGGHSLHAQHQQITRHCEYQDWSLVRLLEERGQTASTLNRPELQKALQLVAAGEADGLIVSKLDRLSRSVVDFGRLLEWFKNADARLIALDLNVDTGTPAGELVAGVMVAVAQWELASIRERTRSGLAAAREKGKPISGPSLIDRPDLVQRVRELRADRTSYQAICDQFNLEGIPTLRGGKEWRRSALQAVLGGPRRSSKTTHQLPEVKR